MPAVVTTIDGVVAPLDQRYELMPAVAVSVTEFPAQIAVDPLGVIVAVGGAVTVTVTGDEVPLHPFVSMTVTL